MRILRTLAALLCLLILAPATARAVTIDQIVAMSTVGVSDAVIVAMIEHDRSVFTLDPAQLVELQQAGVSEAVTVAMIKSDEARPQATVSTQESPAVVSPEPPAIVVYAVPSVVTGRTHRLRVNVPLAAVAPAVQMAAPARGIFFTQPSTGIFFQPPPAANCPLPPISARPR